jgi:hypothetical protein
MIKRFLAENKEKKEKPGRYPMGPPKSVTSLHPDLGPACMTHIPGITPS